MLFSYPAISMNDYDWSQRPWWQKWIILGFTLSCLLIMAWATYGSQFAQLGSRQWLAIAIILITLGLSVFLLSKMRVAPQKLVHRFYALSAHVYTGTGKGGWVSLFPDMIDKIRLSETTFKDERLRIFEVTFKNHGRFLPDFRRIKFGIPGDVDLTLLQDWLKGHCLTIITTPRSSESRLSSGV